MIKRIYLEITDVCNLNCPFCTNPKGNTFMSVDDIKRILDEIKEYTSYIYLHVLGEPLLHPEFNSILNLLDQCDFNLQLVTNGTLLYKYPDLLKHKCLRKLNISVHSVNGIDTDKTYFDTIENLIDNNQNKIIELRFYNNQNLDEKTNAFLNHLKDKYDYQLSTHHNSYEIKKNVYIHYEDLFKWPSIDDEYISDKGTCKGAIDMLAILHNLDVTICCLDPKGHNRLGNLKNNTLKDIVSANNYKKIVEDLRNRKINLELCRKCSYRLRFDGSRN